MTFLKRAKPGVRVVSPTETGIRVHFEPRDCWIGVYVKWRCVWVNSMYQVDVYICVLPMFPIQIMFGLPRLFCWRCWRFTKHIICENCGGNFCLRHAEWDSESSWEFTSPRYPICYRCPE